MALAFKDGIQPTIVPAEYGVVLVLYPAFDILTGLTSLDPVEVRRAPDNAGAPGTWETIAQDIGPIPPRGQIFVDARPPSGDIWWYAHRHVKAGGAVAGGWTASYKSVVKPMFPGDQRFVVPAAGNATMMNTSSRYKGAVGQSGVQSVATGAGGAMLTFDVETSDNGGLHDTAVNNTRVTIPTVNYLGVWMFTMVVTFAANATSWRQASFAKNGALINPSNVRTVVSGTVAETLAVTGFTTTDLVPGDYFEVFVAQNSGVNLNIQGLLSWSHQW